MILLFTGTITMAQQQEPVNMPATDRAEVMTANLIENLDLTEEQQSQVYEIILKREQKRDEGKLEPGSKNEFRAEMKSVLTPEQMKKWEEMRKDSKPRPEGQGNRKGGNQATGQTNDD